VFSPSQTVVFPACRCPASFSPETGPPIFSYLSAMVSPFSPFGFAIQTGKGEDEIVFPTLPHFPTFPLRDFPASEKYRREAFSLTFFTLRPLEFSLLVCGGRRLQCRTTSCPLVRMFKTFTMHSFHRLDRRGLVGQNVWRLIARRVSFSSFFPFLRNLFPLPPSL